MCHRLLLTDNHTPDDHASDDCAVEDCTTDTIDDSNDWSCEKLTAPSVLPSIPLSVALGIILSMLDIFITQMLMVFLMATITLFAANCQIQQLVLIDWKLIEGGWVHNWTKSDANSLSLIAMLPMALTKTLCIIGCNERKNKLLSH